MNAVEIYNSMVFDLATQKKQEGSILSQKEKIDKNADRLTHLTYQT